MNRTDGRTELDPVTVEVIRNKLDGIANEMELTLVQSAFSTIVKADFASLIAAAVLYFLTVGQVRGFALYLGLATILDLVATYFFMGPLIGLMSRRSGLYSHPGRFGIPARTARAEAPQPGAAG